MIPNYIWRYICLHSFQVCNWTCTLTPTVMIISADSKARPTNVSLETADLSTVKHHSMYTNHELTLRNTSSSWTGRKGLSLVAWQHTRVRDCNEGHCKGITPLTFTQHTVMLSKGPSLTFCGQLKITIFPSHPSNAAASHTL